MQEETLFHLARERPADERDALRQALAMMDHPSIAKVSRTKTRKSGRSRINADDLDGPAALLPALCGWSRQRVAGELSLRTRRPTGRALSRRPVWAPEVDGFGEFDRDTLEVAHECKSGAAVSQDGTRRSRINDDVRNALGSRRGRRQLDGAGVGISWRRSRRSIRRCRARPGRGFRAGTVETLLGHRSGLVDGAFRRQETRSGSS
jgi:hypothetical protein